MNLEYHDVGAGKPRHVDEPTTEQIAHAVAHLRHGDPKITIRWDEYQRISVWRLADGALLTNVRTLEGEWARRIQPEAGATIIGRLIDAFSAGENGLDSYRALPLYDAPMSNDRRPVPGSADDSGSLDPNAALLVERLNAEARASVSASAPEPRMTSAPALATTTVYGLAPMFANESEPDSEPDPVLEREKESSIPVPVYGAPPRAPKREALSIPVPVYGAPPRSSRKPEKAPRKTSDDGLPVAVYVVPPRSRSAPDPVPVNDDARPRRWPVPSDNDAQMWTGPISIDDVPGLRPVRGWLLVLEGPQRGKDYRLYEGRNRIGDTPSSCVQLFDSYVSGIHAEIRIDGAEYVLVDQGSTNGSFVNGKPVTEYRLADNDRIRFARTELLIKTVPIY